MLFVDADLVGVVEEGLFVLTGVLWHVRSRFAVLELVQFLLQFVALPPHDLHLLLSALVLMLSPIQLLLQLTIVILDMESQLLNLSGKLFVDTEVLVVLFLQVAQLLVVVEGSTVDSVAALSLLFKPFS